MRNPGEAVLAWDNDPPARPPQRAFDGTGDDVRTAHAYALIISRVARQDDIEGQLARRHLRAGGMALFGLSSSWVEGSHCELAAFGHSRDGKRGKPQIEYGLLTSRDDCPVTVAVFPGNTADPRPSSRRWRWSGTSSPSPRRSWPGDRVMITSVRIKALKEIPGMAWPTCLRAPAIKKLAHNGGPIQLSLFDQQDLAEISSPDYPAEQLIACHNPRLAEERAAHRQRLLAATEAELAKIAAMVEAGRLTDPAKVGVRAGKVINKRKVAKHFILDIGERSFAWRRNHDNIAAEAAFDGI